MPIKVTKVQSKESPKEQPKEDLADFVRRVRTEKGLTTQQVEDRSRGAITRGYVSQIEGRYSINPTPNKLIALAVGLGIPEAQIFKVALGGTAEDDEDFLKSRLGIVSLRMAELGQMTKVDQIKADALIESLERFVDDLERKK